MSIMITLKNIKKEGKTIEAYFFHDNQTTDLFFLKMDTITGEVIEYREPKGYTNHHSPNSHAKRKLLGLAKLDAVPKEAHVYWY